MKIAIPRAHLRVRNFDAREHVSSTSNGSMRLTSFFHFSFRKKEESTRARTQQVHIAFLNQD